MDFILLVVFAIITCITSTVIRKNHIKDLTKKEAALLNVNITNTCRKQERITDARKVELISGSFVLSVNYFEQLISSLKNLFGGQISLYEELLTRARREAMVRLKEQGKNATVISNVRFETSTIGNNMVEVYAYATAIYK